MAGLVPEMTYPINIYRPSLDTTNSPPTLGYPMNEKHFHLTLSSYISYMSYMPMGGLLNVLSYYTTILPGYNPFGPTSAGLPYEPPTRHSPRPYSTHQVPYIYPLALTPATGCQARQPQARPPSGPEKSLPVQYCIMLRFFRLPPNTVPSIPRLTTMGYLINGPTYLPFHLSTGTLPTPPPPLGIFWVLSVGFR